jgi:hypothetical protein
MGSQRPRRQGAGKGLAVFSSQSREPREAEHWLLRPCSPVFAARAREDLVAHSLPVNAALGGTDGRVMFLVCPMSVR